MEEETSRGFSLDVGLGALEGVGGRLFRGIMEGSESAAVFFKFINLDEGFQKQGTIEGLFINLYYRSVPPTPALPMHSAHTYSEQSREGHLEFVTEC